MANYEVGYKKPPQHSQFKPGNRANPHGRGKQEPRKEAEIAREVMNGLVDLREGGKSKRMRRIELLIKCTGAAALRGDLRAAEALLKIRAEFSDNRAIEPALLHLTARDMKAFGG